MAVATLAIWCFSHFFQDFGSLVFLFHTFRTLVVWCFSLFATFGRQGLEEACEMAVSFECFGGVGSARARYGKFWGGGVSLSELPFPEREPGEREPAAQPSGTLGGTAGGTAEQPGIVGGTVEPKQPGTAGGTAEEQPDDSGTAEQPLSSGTAEPKQPEPKEREGKTRTAERSLSERGPKEREGNTPRARRRQEGCAKGKRCWFFTTCAIGRMAC